MELERLMPVKTASPTPREVPMRIAEVMTREVRIASPDETLRQAASMMATIDAGSLPVGDNGRLVGMITDRDIAIRGVGQGLGPDSSIREVMSKDVKYCFEDDDLEDVSKNMGEIQVRRLPVLDHDKKLVGIVSLGDLAMEHDAIAGRALSEISEPGGQHTQEV
jgi:CBS domain-containing protein